MQALENYRRRMNTLNEINFPAKLRKQADDIMKGTWFRGPETVKCRLYKHKEGTRGLEYEDIDETYAKLIHRAVQENIGQRVDMYVEFYPGVSYPVGTYIDTQDVYPDENGNPTWTTWLITNRAPDQQFTLYNILECNYLFKWVNQNKIYQSLGVARGMNSYSAGEQTKASMVNIVNDMCSMWIPNDSVSRNFYYDKRIIVSDMQRHIPQVWRATKLIELYPEGVSKFALLQDKFDAELDVSEKYGYIADINREIIIEDDGPITLNQRHYVLSPFVRLKTSNTYTIKKDHQILFGSYVKIVANLLDENGNSVTGIGNNWLIDGLDSTDYSEIKIDDNSFEFRISRDYSLGRKRFSVVCKADDNSCEKKLDLEIIVL